MKSPLALCLLLLLALPASLTAQKAINEGIKLCESGSYEKAISSITSGLEDSDKLKPKDLAQAHYYRALAQVTYLNKLKSWENLPTEMDIQVYAYGLQAGHDVAAAKKHDTDKKLTAELKPLLTKTENVLIGMAKTDLLEADGMETEDSRAQQCLERVVQFGDAGIALDRFNYVHYNLKAEGLLGQGDKAGALESFKIAASYFFRSAPKGGDLDIAYTYLHIAEMEMELNSNLKAAKEAIATGLEKLEGENQKIQVHSNRRPAEKAGLADYFEELRGDLLKAQAKYK